MATLGIPPALYDFVLFYECADKDWIKGSNKTSIKGDGSLMSMINWNSTYSYDPDDRGGKTLFGVTESTWKTYVQKFPNKGYSEDLNTMGKQGWLDQIEWFWSSNCCGDKCANFACGFVMFQMAWGGYTLNALNRMVEKLKSNADKKDYQYTTKSYRYSQIADATHAYTDPMKAYNIMRNELAQYYYNISTPDKTNKKFRNGWLTRSALSFTPSGLYIPTTISYKTAGLKYESELSQWIEASNQWLQNETSGYVKILDWGASPEAIQEMLASSYIYKPSSNSNGQNSTISSGAYGGCGDVLHLGNFSNNYSQQLMTFPKNREDVLKTLLKGATDSTNIKVCEELITVDRIKNEKSEN